VGHDIGKAGTGENRQVDPSGHLVDSQKPDRDRRALKFEGVVDLKMRSDRAAAQGTREDLTDLPLVVEAVRHDRHETTAGP
jgi:hypothetical protein